MTVVSARSTPHQPLNPSVRRTVTNSNISIPLSLKLIVISVLVPDEISFRLAGLLLSPSQVLLLALTPVMLIRMGNLLATGRYRFVLSDLLVPLTGFGMIYSLMETEPTTQEALIHAGPLALEYCIGYLVTRSMLSGRGQAIAFINFLCVGIGIVALLGLLDTVTHRYFIHATTMSILGGPTQFGTAGDRLGLLRAVSTLRHPILFGATCSFALFLAVATPIRRRAFVIFSCSIGIIISLSAAPMQAAFLGFGLLTYNRALAGIRFRWALLIATVTLVTVIIFTTIDNPFGFVFNHLVFDTKSSYYRIYIWTTATAALEQSPWYGFGFVFPDQYQIPATVNSMWLVWALQFGIPLAAVFALSMIASTSLPTSGRDVLLTAAEMKLGIALSILICLIIFLGFTVDFFGTAWIVIPLLVGVRARLGELGGQVR